MRQAACKNIHRYRGILKWLVLLQLLLQDNHCQLKQNIRFSSMVMACGSPGPTVTADATSKYLQRGCNQLNNHLVAHCKFLVQLTLQMQLISGCNQLNNHPSDMGTSSSWWPKWNHHTVQHQCNGVWNQEWLCSQHLYNIKFDKSRNNWLVNI